MKTLDKIIIRNCTNKNITLVQAIIKKDDKISYNFNVYDDDSGVDNNSERPMYILEPTNYFELVHGETPKNQLDEIKIK